MGYHTEFEGEFTLDKPVDDATFALLRGLGTTRRMARNVDPSYGVEGEFFVEKSVDPNGDSDDATIIDRNRPPKSQPSLWCQWLIDDDKQTIAWDEQEKFYEYRAWIGYLVDHVIAPRGYVLNGRVKWIGENDGDAGIIVVTNNHISLELPY
jgi:hypothetical protein